MSPNLGVLQEIDLGPLAPHHMSEVIVGIVLMLIIFVIMWKVVVPAFEKMYQERSDKIEGGMQRAARAEAKAEAALADYTEQLKAAREAMVNAAKHSGAPDVDVYAEVSDGTVEVFVRDRGRGFDPDVIAEDRHGVRGSILERMGRHHGTARITSHPDRGTEVSLEMKR